MPIYSYRCQACGVDLELMSSIDSRDDKMCEDCGSRLHRKIDRPGAVWNPTRSSGGMRT